MAGILSYSNRLRHLHRRCWHLETDLRLVVSVLLTPDIRLYGESASGICLNILSSVVEANLNENLNKHEGRNNADNSNKTCIEVNNRAEKGIPKFRVSLEWRARLTDNG